MNANICNRVSTGNSKAFINRLLHGMNKSPTNFSFPTNISLVSCAIEGVGGSSVFSGRLRSLSGGEQTHSVNKFPSIFLAF